MARIKHLTVEVVEHQIQYWENVRQILLRIGEESDDDIEVRIYKKYLKHGNVATVATELNDEGFRLTSESTGKQRKYISNDVSDTIRSRKIDDEEMMNLARAILKDHTVFINRLFN